MTFDAISHWLPLVSLQRSDDHQQDSVQDNPVSGIDLAADTSDDSAEYDTPGDPIDCDNKDGLIYGWNDNDDFPLTQHDTPTEPATTAIIPFPLPQPIMDICRMLTQNVHGLWCQPRNGDGSVIPICRRDMTKLEFPVYRMRCNDIEAWRVQETWSEEDVFDTNIGGYHMFRTKSPVGSTGCDHPLSSILSSMEKC